MPTSQRLRRFQPTFERLAGRWGSAGPLLPGFRLLAQGRPVSVVEIAAAAAAEVDQVEKAVNAARCERDGNGRLIDLYGMTLNPTLHRLTIGGKILFGCCALWAHIIPKLVGATALVDSVDPMRRESVRLSISPSGVGPGLASGVAASLAVASQEAIDRDVGEAFCCQVCHFVSRESAEAYAASRSTCHVVELAELEAAAGALHQSIWSAVGA